MMSWGFHRGKWKMRALPVLFSHPLFLVALIKQGRERKRGEKERVAQKSLIKHKPEHFAAITDRLGI